MVTHQSLLGDFLKVKPNALPHTSSLQFVKKTPFDAQALA